MLAIFNFSRLQRERAFGIVSAQYPLLGLQEKAKMADALIAYWNRGTILRSDHAIITVTA